MSRLTVHGSTEYDIIIENGLLARAGSLLRDELGGSKALILSDSNVAGLYLNDAADSLREAGYEVFTVVMPAGEQTKDIENYTFLLNILAEHEMSKSDLLIALGGGVIGDLAGFAAATFKRGMKCVQIPTSLLAAVDSSVGGKNAINLQSAKNQVGTIRNPSIVLCDPELINTLPEAAMRDGRAEIIKYGILNGPEIIEELRRVDGGEETQIVEGCEATSGEDKSVLDEQVSDGDARTYEDKSGKDYSAVIEMAVRIKRDIVEMDEGDQSFRQYLNLGHLIGHGIEAESDYAITHGEAVAAGLVLEARCCAFYGFTELTTYMEISELVESFGFDLFKDYSSRLEELLPYILKDKRIRNGKIQILVPYGIGDCNMRLIEAEQLEEFLRAGK